MVKLKLQSVSHLMQRTDSPEKILMLGMIEDRGSRSCCERAEHYLQYMWFYLVHKKSHQGFSVENSFKFIF